KLNPARPRDAPPSGPPRRSPHPTPTPPREAPPMRKGSTSRRVFLMNSAAAAGAAATVSLSNVAHAAGSDTIRVGVVGCGGRGTGAAEQALSADEGCRLVAMGELFADRLESSLG